MSISVDDRAIILVGASGHARVLIHLLQSAKNSPSALTDIDETLHGTDLYGVPVIGGDDAILARQPSDVVLVNAVGNAPGSGQSGLHVRRAVFEKFKEYENIDLYTREGGILEKIIIKLRSKIRKAEIKLAKNRQNGIINPVQNNFKIKESDNYWKKFSKNNNNNTAGKWISNPNEPKKIIN